MSPDNDDREGVTKRRKSYRRMRGSTACTQEITGMPLLMENLKMENLFSKSFVRLRKTESRGTPACS